MPSAVCVHSPLGKHQSPQSTASGRRRSAAPSDDSYADGGGNRARRQERGWGHRDGREVLQEGVAEGGGGGGGPQRITKVSKLEAEVKEAEQEVRKAVARVRAARARLEAAQVKQGSGGDSGSGNERKAPVSSWRSWWRGRHLRTRSKSKGQASRRLMRLPSQSQRQEYADDGG